MKARIEEIFNLVAEQITESDMAGPPAGIVITGGGAMLKDIEKPALE